MGGQTETEESRPARMVEGRRSPRDATWRKSRGNTRDRKALANMMLASSPAGPITSIIIISAGGAPSREVNIVLKAVRELLSNTMDLLELARKSVVA